MLDHFHNTINASGDTLVAHTITCKSQEERILAIFKETHFKMTPFEVLEKYSKLYKEVPITSIRRAMSNLTEENKLLKLPSMKTEKYGKPNFEWSYNFSFGK
jgi:Fe2+ or Zn2+ uptake regulation protein